MSDDVWYIQRKDDIEGPLTEWDLLIYIGEGKLKETDWVSRDKKTFAPAVECLGAVAFEQSPTQSLPSPKIEETPETKACPFCGENILSVAVVCKHCKSDLTQKANATKAPSAPPKSELTEAQKKNVQNMTYGCMGCGGIVVFGIILLMLAGSGKRTPSKIDAATHAERFVTQVLKAPSTAKFPHDSEYTIRSEGGGKFTVSGYVDSQNSFGAMIRSRFVVTLTMTTTDKATLNNISVN